MEIGIGIVGWGFMGRTHAHAVREIPLFYPNCGFRPVIRSVCSGRAENARRAAEVLEVAHFTDQLDELLGREDVQVVSICTPNELHEDMAIRAMRAGKHVYLDKPVATTADAARRIMDAAAEAGVLGQVVLNNRFFPATMRAKQLVEEGRIGEVTGFRCQYLHSGSVDAGKAIGWKMAEGAGVLLDLGSHALDLITWLVGWPERLCCSLRTLYASRPVPGGGETQALGDDQAVIMMKLPGGAIGTVEASKIATGTEDELSFEVYGTKGALRFSLMDANFLHFFDQAKPDLALGGERGYQRIACVARYEAPAGSFLPPKNTIGWDRAHIHCYYSFLKCVAEGKQPSPDLVDGWRLQALMDLCRVSDREGRWVEVSV